MDKAIKLIDSNVEKIAISDILKNIIFMILITQLFKLNSKILTYLKYEACLKPSLQVVADLNDATIDLNATIIKFCIEKHQLINVLVDGRSSINIMANYISTLLSLLQFKVTSFILYIITMLELSFLRYYET